MAPKCTVCDKSVYPMDELKIDDLVMHKACLRCAHCNNTLSLGKYAALEGKYYCKPHFKQLFALKGNYNEGFGTEQHKKKWQAGSGDADKGVETVKSELEKSPSKRHLNDDDDEPSHKKSKADVLADDESGPQTVRPVADRIRGSIDDLSKAMGYLNKTGSRSNLSGSRGNLGSRGNMVTRSKGNLETSHEELSSNGKARSVNQRMSMFPGAIKRDENSDAPEPGTLKKRTSLTPDATGKIAAATNKCQSCAKTVYPMEQCSVEGVTFHKACFKCEHCNGVLSLGKYAALEGKYYCKPHFKQLFALKGN
eukprot:Partr_v1_DN28153_c2_g2_i1_m56021 putative LIM domain and actin binding 1